MKSELVLGTSADNVFSAPELKSFRRALLRWYDVNKRDLPWRRDTDPYHVWVSEIMLQQTRVAVVIDYYERFLRRFADVHSLARARDASVLALWSGLGYYRRARSLHAAARIISKERKGSFPQTSEAWAELPGIGAYTSAAIASIAFGQACAVVDGNVERVLQRVTGNVKLAGKPLWEAAQNALESKRPGDFNQAMMELGATICTPDQPACDSCPVRRWCSTRGPVGKRSASPRERRTVKYGLNIRDGQVYLVKRAAGRQLMPGMWELPACHPALQVEDIGLQLRHSITGTDYTVHVVRAECRPVSNGRWIPLSRVATFPLTGLARKILRKANLI